MNAFPVDPARMLTPVAALLFSTTVRAQTSAS